ncbi:MAG: hypothetical protein Q7T88_07840 [Methylotenera sp.]|nr:hypothetical protein [Methylotenera sp.]
MAQPTRKNSPRAPSISLEDALNRVLKVYDKERRHEVPIDVVAVDVGYKNGKSGAALQTLASIRYFGLMQRPKEGVLVVSAEVEKYKFSPDPEHKQQLLNSWLRTPQVFSDLLDKFQTNLPSDAVIKYELIQLGFNSSAADDFITIFKKSVEFVRYYEQAPSIQNIEQNSAEIEGDAPNEELGKPISNTNPSNFIKMVNPVLDYGADRVPIRLAGGRKAFLEIPTPFYEADKLRLIAQINLILTDEDDISDLI